MGGEPSGPRADRDDHADRAARTRRRDAAARLCGPARRGRLFRLQAGLHGRRRQGDGALHGAYRRARGPDREGGAPAAERRRRAARGNRAFRISAECRGGRNGGIPVGLGKPLSHAAPDGGGGVRSRSAGERRGSARRAPRGHRPAIRAGRERRGAGERRRDCARHAVAARGRGGLGAGAGPDPVGWRGRLHPRGAVREGLRRASAGLRLGGRSDAPSLRERVRAEPCLRSVLPLAQERLPRRYRPAFRDAWRARIHAGQAGGRGAGRLAGPADRRHAERLSLRREQPLGGDAREAPLGRGDGQPPDAAAERRGALQGTARAQGIAHPLARDGARRRAGGGARRADRGAGRGGRSRRRPGDAVGPASGDGRGAHPRRAARGRRADERCGARELPVCLRRTPRRGSGWRRRWRAARNSTA